MAKRSTRWRSRLRAVNPGLRQLVDFDKRNARRAAVAADLGGVAAGSKREHNRSILATGRQRKCADAAERGTLRRVPIIIAGERSFTALANDIEAGIDERSGHTEVA